MSTVSATRKAAQKSARKTKATTKASQVFTAEEKAAMRARAREMKASEDKVEAENAVMAAIDEMQEPDRSMARRIHDIIKASAPALSPRLWYGMPAYARDGSVICFFQSAQKFKSRYATLGFNNNARLDDGVFWPVAYAVKELTPAEEARIGALVKKAVS